MTGGSYASALAEGQTHEYVQLDTTFYNDCRHIPPVATVILAIKKTFGADEDRRIIAPRRNNAGVWRIETSNTAAYKSVDVLCTPDGKEIAKVTVRHETIRINEHGRAQRSQAFDPTDLLVTLPSADTFPLNTISDEEILTAIIELDIGVMKRAPQRQIDRRTNEYTGNKFFVLTKVSEEARNQVPNELVFTNPTFGKLVLTLSHRFRVRHCYFCGKKHGATCLVREKVAALKKERTTLHTHICGDSTVRYLNEGALHAGVDAMSGGTTGNLINSLEVDDEVASKKILVFVSGANDLKPELSPEEFLFSLKKVRERVCHLLENGSTRVALLPPPTTLMDVSAEALVRRELYSTHLGTLESKGARVWPNPLEGYDEDDGTHPSVEQTVALARFLDKRVSEEFGVPFLLPSATDEVIALPNKYDHVTSLYKFGCGACARRERNKWRNICDQCKSEATQDDELRTDLRWYRSKLDSLAPAVGDDLETDELKCEICDVCFHDLSDFNLHFKETHIGVTPRYKRSITEGKGRRNKSTPSRSLGK